MQGTKAKAGRISHLAQMAVESTNDTTAGVPMTSTIATDTKNVITLSNAGILRSSARSPVIWKTVRTSADVDRTASGTPKIRVVRMTAEQAAIKAIMSIKESRPNVGDTLAMFTYLGPFRPASIERPTLSTSQWDRY